MRILIIKMSSMGDLVHTLPALVEAKKNVANITFDWLVDDSLKDILYLYQSLNDANNQNCQSSNNIIDNILTIPLRAIKHKFSVNKIKSSISILKDFTKNLRKNKYDLTIDAQGLLKSSIIARFAKTDLVVGFDFKSCREPLASIFYNYKVEVDRNLHAINRIRQLFAKAIKYDISLGVNSKVDFGLKNNFVPAAGIESLKKYVLFLHGTTWESKRWEIDYWQQLACLIVNQYKNIRIVLLSSSLEEHQFVQQLQKLINKVINKDYEIHNNQEEKVIELSNLSIIQAGQVVANATAVVGVDTGLAHLAGAIGVPVVGIYGASDVKKAGVIGLNSYNIQSGYHCSPCLSRICLEYQKNNCSSKQPCMREITPELVFSKLNLILNDLK